MGEREGMNKGEERRRRKRGNAIREGKRKEGKGGTKEKGMAMREIRRKREGEKGRK